MTTSKTITYYIYDTETDEQPSPVVARIHGADNAECERIASEQYGGDRFGGTYSPAFGTVDGLVETTDTIDVYVEGE